MSVQVQESMQFPFKKQMRVEVVDKTHLCRTRVALVEQVSHSKLSISGRQIKCLFARVVVYEYLCILKNFLCQITWKHSKLQDQRLSSAF